MPRPSLPALRRVAVAAVAVAGVALVGTSVSGIAQIDASLADAQGEQAPARYQAVSFERRSAVDCPNPGSPLHRQSRQHRAPVTY